MYARKTLRKGPAPAVLESSSRGERDFAGSGPMTSGYYWARVKGYGSSLVPFYALSVEPW